MLGDVDYAMDVERDFLCVCAPMLVVEAVGVFSVFGCDERVVAGGDATFVDLVSAGGSLDLGIYISLVGVHDPLSLGTQCFDKHNRLVMDAMMVRLATR